MYDSGHLMLGLLGGTIAIIARFLVPAVIIRGQTAVRLVLVFPLFAFTANEF
jgi:hypothetical protein